ALEATSVVVHVDPAADVEAVAVQRHRLAVEQVRGEQRDELLRVLVRAVVVAAPGDGDVDPVGAGEGDGDEVAARLGRGVGGVRVERRLLGPGALGDRAVDLVGGNVHDSRDAGGPAGVEQGLHAGHVGHDELGRAGDRPVDVRLGGEVDHRVVAGQHLGQLCRVADVTLDERVPRVVLDRGEVGEVAR